MPTILETNLETNDDSQKKSCMLTTIDNPFNPFTNFDEWFNMDMLLGYNTLNYLARIAKVSPSLVDVENDRIVKDAIFDILRYDPNPNYVLVWNDRPFNINKIKDSNNQ